MVVAVNTRLLLKNKLEGIGWFTHESLKRMVLAHPEHQFIFLFDRAYDPEFIFAANVKPVVVFPQARHPLLYIIWFEMMLPRILRKYKVDVFVSTDGFVSLRSKIPSIAVVHDLNFEHYPQHLPSLVLKYLKFFMPRFARHAGRIVTVSEYSKKDIERQYKIESSKIDVAYNGVNESYSPMDEETQSQVRNELTGGQPYFYFVGALHPRKNLEGLFKAFDLYKMKQPNNTKLVVVGNKMWWTPSIKERYEQMKYRDSVVFLGHQSPERLNQIVASGIALVYVSYFEGFGIPIVEAFKAQTAVITSNVTSMPEVAGDAALLVDPSQPQQIAEAMFLIENDVQLREQLISKGLERVKNFSWDTTSQILWNSIEKLHQQVSKAPERP